MIRVELVKRPQRSALFSALSPIVALVLTLFAGAIIFALMGKNPLEGLHQYFVVPISGLWDPNEAWQLHKLAIKAAPLIIIAVGLSICYQSNNWNIGAEGQLIVGAICGSLVPTLLPGFQNALTLPLMILFGMAGGALYAGIPALLKTRFNTNEILTSLMLVYVAQLFLDWLARGLLRDPKGNNFPGSVRFPDAARVHEIMPSAGDAHWGVVWSILIAVAVWLMLSKTLKGFEIRVQGASPRAGRFAGFSARRTIFFAFLFSGALAGLAGIVEVAGPTGQLREVVSPGYGFTAIIVAFLGRLNPLGIVAAGFVLALTYLGGEQVQVALGVSDKMSRVFQGLILFFVLGCDTLIHYRVRLAGLGIPKQAARA